MPNCGQKHILVQTLYKSFHPALKDADPDFSNRSLVSKRSINRAGKGVLQKITVDGLTSTFDAIQYKLNDLLPLGYCNVGQIKECSILV